MRQNTERLEKQEEECKIEAEFEEKERRRVDWADIDLNEPVNDETCMNLGSSVEIEYPQEEQRGEQWRQGGQNEQLAEARRGEWAWQGGGMTESDEGERRERKREIDIDKGEKTDDMTGNSDVRHLSGRDWGHSLERKRASSRRERREWERANWNSGGQVRLFGFGQDHWEGEMGSWCQDQWWDSGTWG